MEKEKQLLALCRLLIEQSLNWGESSIWSNNDFEQLSEKIFDKTRVQLSISTLKRIWGKVRYENFPTSGTLNALVRFLDYDSWRDFRQKNQENANLQSSDDQTNSILEEDNESTAATIAISKSKPSNFNKSGISLLIVGLLITLSIIFLTRIYGTKTVDLSKIKLEAIKTSDSLPNSVIFNYDASPFKSDSVYIQQSWDPTRREKVSANEKQHTSIYYNPGYFIAKLIVDNQIKKECFVYIKTKGWKGIIERRPIPIYLSDNEIKGKGYMGISDSLFRVKIGVPVFNDTWVKFANVREFKGIDAGNFSFEASIRNSSVVEASVCRQAKALVLGTGSAIIIPLADKGCVSELNLLTGDGFINGKDHDMSAFGCDFRQFQHLKVTVKEHRLKVYLNNKLVLNTEQKYSIEQVTGLRFEFEGGGEVKNVKLSTPGSTTYYSDF
ncbi:MAG TPA: hypothetical protein VGN20_23035 [Mucilaginibacter sp.]|jgi:hypothetical protein